MGEQIKKIVVTKDGNGFEARLEGGNSVGLGRTSAEAVGDLLEFHPELFPLVVVERRKSTPSPERHTAL